MAAAMVTQHSCMVAAAERRYYEDSDLEMMLEMERRRMAGLQ
eukprot:SM012605S26361  [mRNA]  locus=s12605:246:368:- [translate_table: standard]